MPITDPPIDASTPPAEGGSASGVLPAADALIWSGPAIMEFPPANSHGPGDAPAGLPSDADLARILSHADLDPMLASMGTGGESDALFDPGHGDLSAAFLPPGDPDTLLFGADAGMVTPPPLPPPPTSSSHAEGPQLIAVRAGIHRPPSGCWSRTSNRLHRRVSRGFATTQIPSCPGEPGNLCAPCRLLEMAVSC